MLASNVDNAVAGFLYHQWKSCLGAKAGDNMWTRKYGCHSYVFRGIQV